MKNWFKKIMENSIIELSEAEVKSGINCKAVQKNHSVNIDSGFYIVKTKQIISWDTPLNEIAELSCIEAEYDEYKSKFLIFNETVIIENLAFFNFKIRYPDLKFQREDVPVDSISNSLKIIDASEEENYFFIKDTLIKVIGKPAPCYEHDSGNASHWRIGQLDICLSLSKRTSPEIPGKNLWFRIENIRDYTYLISEFRKNIIPTHFIHFEKKGFHIAYPDFRKINCLYLTPAGLVESFNRKTISIIWKQGTELIGFSDKNYSYIFHYSELESIELQNVLPGRGGGFSTLTIRFKEESKLMNFYLMQDLYLFDKYIKLLIDFFEDKITVLDPTYE